MSFLPGLGLRLASIQTGPSVTVDNLVTTDTTPTVTGTIDDLSATISVVVNSNTYTGTNVGDGTWTADVTDALAAGSTYDVAVTATDAAGNVGTDATSNELTILLDIRADVAIFTLPSATDGDLDVAVDLSGDTPIGAIFACTGHATANDPGPSDHCQLGTGFLDDTREYSQTFRSRNGQASGGVYRDSEVSTYGLILHRADSTSRQFQVSLNAFEADNLNLTFALVTPGFGSRRAIVVAFGGADLNFYADGTEVPSAGATHTVAAGFQAEMALLNSAFATGLNSSFAYYVSGMAHRDGTERTRFWNENAAASGNPSLEVFNDRCLDNSGGNLRLDINDFGASNTVFDKTNWGSARDVGVALFGGAKCSVQSFTEPATAGDVTISVPGLYPVFAKIEACLATSFGGGPYTDATAEAISDGYVVGSAADETITAQAYVSGFIEDAAATTNTKQDCQSGYVIALYDSTGSLVSRATVSAWDADSITLTFDTVTGNQIVGYIGILGQVSA